MPPTRGHDLKQESTRYCNYSKEGMPPTRGHDLKLAKQGQRLYR